MLQASVAFQVERVEPQALEASVAGRAVLEGHRHQASAASAAFQVERGGPRALVASVACRAALEGHHLQASAAWAAYRAVPEGHHREA
mgnify:CR=1 FL=1